MKGFNFAYLVLPILFLLSIPSITAYLYTPDDYTALYLPFDDCAGSYVSDKSSFLWDGATSGSPTWLGSADCVSGCCLSTNSTSNYAYVPDTNHLDFTENMSIAFWYKTPIVTRQPIVAKSLETSTPNYGVIVEAGSDNELVFTRSPSTLTYIGSSVVANNNKYHCVVATRNTSHVMIYNDGVLTTTATAYTMVANNNPLYIGGDGNSHSSNFVVDELIIENTTINTTWANTYCNAYDTGCGLCGTWRTNNTCLNGVEQFIRDCPTFSTCTNTSYWTATEYCGGEYNRSHGIYQQKTRPYSVGKTCYSEWLKRDMNYIGLSDCEPEQLTIPNDCTNISVREDTSVIVQGTPNNNGNFTTTSCTPTYNCLQEKKNCINLNSSYTHYMVNDNYTVGQTATGFSKILINDVCWRGSWFLGEFNPFTNGIETYRVKGALTVTCEIPCKEETYCIDENYLASRHPDCTYNISLNPCDNGCDKENDVCFTNDTGTNPNPDTGMTGVYNNILHPNATTKFIYASVGILALGGLGLALNFSMKAETFVMPVVFISIGWIFFTYFGWIPPIFTVIIVIFGGVAFWLTNKS